MRYSSTLIVAALALASALAITGCYDDDPPGPGATAGELDVLHFAYVCDGSSAMGKCSGPGGTSERFPAAIAVGATFRVVPAPRASEYGFWPAPARIPEGLVPIADTLAVRTPEGDCLALREGEIGLVSYSSTGQAVDYLNVIARSPRRLRFRHVSPTNPIAGLTIGDTLTLAPGQAAEIAVLLIDDAGVPLAGRIAYEFGTTDPSVTVRATAEGRGGAFVVVTGNTRGRARVVARGAGLEAGVEVVVE